MDEYTQDYVFPAIRKLLCNAFTSSELDRFCQDHALFRPVTTSFSNEQGLDVKVDLLFDYCIRHLLLDDLLVAVKAVNPRMYELCEPYDNETHARQSVVNLRPWDRPHAFQDRTEKMAELRKHLGDRTARMICIEGPGGMGKTALACYVLAELEPKAPSSRVKLSDEVSIDGILYLSAKSTGVRLEDIRAGVEPMLDGPTVRQLREQWKYAGASLDTKVKSLLAALRGKSYVILLDNLEECLTPEGTIEEDGLRLFIQSCLEKPTEVRLITTSRRQIMLPASTYPSSHTIDLRDGLPEDDAVRFLQKLDPDGKLGLRDAREETLRSGWRHTEGIPLALELLAGLLCDDPAACLDELLARPELVDRQVVGRLLDTIWPRLSNDELHVLQALAILDRPVGKEAISFLLQPWFPDLDIQSALRRLARNYVVTAHRPTGTYSLHLLNWEYVNTKLPVDERPDDCNRRNLHLRSAEYYRGKRKPESEWRCLDDVAPQLAEFEHQVQAGDVEHACRVLDRIDSCLSKWGHYTRLVELRGRLAGKIKDPIRDFTNLVRLGEAHGALGRDEMAIDFYEKALCIALGKDDRARKVSIYRNLGVAHRNLGHDEAALQFFERALSVAPRGQNPEETARVLNDQGVTFWHQERIEQALDCFERVRTIAEDSKDGELCSLTLGHLGIAYHKLGQLSQALEAHERARSEAKKIAHRQMETRHISNIGYVCHDLGEFKQAAVYQLQAIEIAHQIGNVREESNQLDHLGSDYHSLGQYPEAVREYEKSLEMVQALRNSRGESYRRLGLSKALLGMMKLDEAQDHCERALALDIPGWTAYMLPLTLGVVLLYKKGSAPGGAFARAVEAARAMLSRTNRLYKAQYALAAALVGNAVCDLSWRNENERLGLLAPSLAEYRQALDICSAPGVVHDALWVLEMIRCAGIEGLEPVSELLQNAPNRPSSVLQSMQASG